ncbi:glycosyl hydrolase [Clostridiales bacterium COT073_COT-073]|nr:glycosyl hydrolase [Clostridiales bacterium COT073_COT-073]
MKTREKILRSLSRQQKARLFVGKNNWQLEAIKGKHIFLSDGPHGIRKEVWKKGKKYTVKAVCYPVAALSACSFDPDLMQEYGAELAKECIHHGIDVLLGPGINIKRNPLCGRNFEYFSEDPYLSGKLAAAYIQGVQSKNVGVSLKHYALNSQEYARMINDSVVDDRALREIYVKAFEIAIKESAPWTIMASYNQVNGRHATENERLLNQMARQEFGFAGAFISDWGALYQPVDSLKAGLDLEMPGLSKGSETAIIKAIESGELAESVLEASTGRLLDLYEKTEQPKTKDFNLYHALALAKRISDESMVLLKNENQRLPLNKEQKFALIGDFCLHPRYQGAGSSQINPVYLSNLYHELKKEGMDFEFARGYQADEPAADQVLIEEAKKIARNKEVVVILCGLPSSVESEGFDRENLKLPESQLTLIDEIAKVNRNLVIILQNGAPVEMPFLSQAQAVLETYLGGSMHAHSIKDVLLGKVCPSGRLAETFPLKYEDVPSADYYLKNRDMSLYKESIYVGYRYYDSFEQKVQFPFGYGLSYADITYSGFQVKQVGQNYVASFQLTNHSDILAKEVVQLYVGQTKPVIFKPKKELKAFAKITLGPKESRKISLTVKARDLRYYSIANQNWQMESGNYRFYLAKHAMDESLFVDVWIQSDTPAEARNPKLDIYYSMHRSVEDREFEELLGRKIEYSHVPAFNDINRKRTCPFCRKSKRKFTTDTPLSEFCRTALGFAVFRPIIAYMIATTQDDLEKVILARAIPDLPLRAWQMKTAISKMQMNGMVDIFNGNWKSGLKKLLTYGKDNS